MHSKRTKEALSTKGHRDRCAMVFTKTLMLCRSIGYVCVHVSSMCVDVHM